MGRQVESGVQSSTGRMKLLGRYKIGYADWNGAIDERGFSWRARPGWPAVESAVALGVSGSERSGGRVVLTARWAAWPSWPPMASVPPGGGIPTTAGPPAPG